MDVLLQIHFTVDLYPATENLMTGILHQYENEPGYPGPLMADNVALSFSGLTGTLIL